MNTWFILAFAVTILVGLNHSILGEKFIINPLQNFQNLPPIFGSDLLTKHTLRFAWHLTTVAWFGLASFMFILAIHIEPSTKLIIVIFFATFAVSFLLSLIGSRDRHFSWIMFLSISIFLLLGLRYYK